MSVDPKKSSLHQSAQKIGIPFKKCWNPIDRHIEVNGLKLHFLELVQKYLVAEIN